MHLRKINLSSKKKAAVILLFVALIAMGLIGLLGNFRTVNYSKCKTVFSAGDKSVQDNKNKEALRKLQPLADKCTALYKDKGNIKKPGKTKEKILAMQYYADIATATYRSGDKPAAHKA